MIRTTIHANEVFDRVAAQQALGLSKTALAREVRLGRLRCAKRGGRHYFLGTWIMDWLRNGEVRRNATVTQKSAAMTNC